MIGLFNFYPVAADIGSAYMHIIMFFDNAVHDNFMGVVLFVSFFIPLFLLDRYLRKLKRGC